MDRIAREDQHWQIRKAAALACGPPSGGCSDEIIFLINLDNSPLIYGSVCTNRTFFFFFLLVFFLYFQGEELGAWWQAAAAQLLSTLDFLRHKALNKYRSSVGGSERFRGLRDPRGLRWGSSVRTPISLPLACSKTQLAALALCCHLISDTLAPAPAVSVLEVVYST